MKILITGANGFLGLDLTRRLAGEKRHEIVCSVRETSDVSKLEKLNVSFVKADVTDGPAFSDAVAMVKPDAVYHCAAKVWLKDEKELFENNVKGTREVCGACYRHGVKRLIYLSSVAVISGNDKVPLTDDMEHKCSDAYGRSKAEAEKAALYYREKGLLTAILRPCMVYGEDEPHALGGIMSAIERRRLPVLDDPCMDARLGLVYVGNVTDALVMALYGQEALTGTFIVADKETITIRKFINIIAEELGSPDPFVIPAWVVKTARILPSVRRKMGRIFKDRVYDISRLRDVLGYVPRVSTEDGLRMTARHWKLYGESQNKKISEILPKQDV